MIDRVKMRTVLGADLRRPLVVASSAFIVAPASAGQCPADKTKPGVRTSGEMKPKDVTDTVLGMIELGRGEGRARRPPLAPAQARRPARRRRAVAQPRGPAGADLRRLGRDPRIRQQLLGSDRAQGRRGLGREERRVALVEEQRQERRRCCCRPTSSTTTSTTTSTRCERARAARMQAPASARASLLRGRPRRRNGNGHEPRPNDAASAGARSTRRRARAHPAHRPHRLPDGDRPLRHAGDPAGPDPGLRSDAGRHGASPSTPARFGMAVAGLARRLFQPPHRPARAASWRASPCSRCRPRSSPRRRTSRPSRLLRVAQGLCMASAFTLTLAYLGEHCSADGRRRAPSRPTSPATSRAISSAGSSPPASPTISASAPTFLCSPRLNLAGAALVHARADPCDAMMPERRRSRPLAVRGLDASTRATRVCGRALRSASASCSPSSAPSPTSISCWCASRSRSIRWRSASSTSSSCRRSGRRSLAGPAVHA